MEVKQAATLSFKNREALEQSNFCSCYHCSAKFDVKEIKEWTDGDVTAICPKCNIDAVIPGSIPDQTLKQMREYWFGISNQK